MPSTSDEAYKSSPQQQQQSRPWQLPYQTQPEQQQLRQHVETEVPLEQRTRIALGHRGVRVDNPSWYQDADGLGHDPTRD